MKRARERPSQKSARIVVLGDSGVGKSSLVTVFISAHFEENLSSLIPVAVSTQQLLGPTTQHDHLCIICKHHQVLPPEATGESVSITLVDT